MTVRRDVTGYTVAVSISETSEMPELGLAPAHLEDAMTQVAQYLLALGVRIAYGGDLRLGGFTGLLFEVAARHRSTEASAETTQVDNYLAWPVHSQMAAASLVQLFQSLTGLANALLLGRSGDQISLGERLQMETPKITAAEWGRGLTAMRDTMTKAADARIVLGGRTERFKGVMPGIAEETLLTLQARKPIFLLGGFGGAAQDIAETLGLLAKTNESTRSWQRRSDFEAFGPQDLRNGLTLSENETLASTVHIDQAMALILRGLFRLNKESVADFAQ